MNDNQNSSNVSLFDFKGHEVRVVKHEDAPWFAAGDVCEVLDMDLHAGTSRWLAGLSPDEKQRVSRSELPQLFCGSRAGSLNIISESGLYKLVMRSDKPEAKAFQDWVTREVLPSIRKNGGYIKGQEKVATGEMSAAELARSVVGGNFCHTLRTDDEAPLAPEVVPYLGVFADRPVVLLNRIAL